MKVYDVEIPEEAVFAELPAVRCDHWAIRRVLSALGVPQDRHRHSEAANRLLQKWRKAGRVQYINRAWTKT